MKVSEMFSSSDNTSFGRCSSFITLVFILSWASTILYKLLNLNNLTAIDLKSAIPEIPSTWLAIILGPYAISKGFQVAGLVFGKDKSETT